MEELSSVIFGLTIGFVIGFILGTVIMTHKYEHRLDGMQTRINIIMEYHNEQSN